MKSLKICRLKKNSVNITPSEKKAVKKAYEDAILHRCRVTGENASVVSAVVLE